MREIPKLCDQLYYVAIILSKNIIVDWTMNIFNQIIRLNDFQVWRHLLHRNIQIEIFSI